MPDRLGAAIRIDQVEQRFGPLLVLDRVNLSIEPGEFVAVLGPSGCGKSTLLAILAGLLGPTAGQVRVDDRPVIGPTADAGIVFQKDLLLDWRTALDNVLLQVELRGHDTSTYRDRAADLLTMVGLGDFLDVRPRRLSGGMRQRVALCRALLHEPRLLLLDEPFGALDALTREQLNLDVSRMAASTGSTVVLVTHSIEEAAFLADRVLVMSPRPGVIVSDLTVDVPRPRLEFPHGTSAFAPVIDAARQLVGAGALAQPIATSAWTRPSSPVASGTVPGPSRRRRAARRGPE